jgi:hypothetical protein
MHRSLFGKDALEQKLQHWTVTGFRQFDRFAHELDFFVFEQGLGH